MSRTSDNIASATPSTGAVVSGEQAESLPTFEAEVIAFFVEAADLLGVPKSVAAIYGVIFASPEPIGFAEIESRLELSKGSVSQGLKALREMGAIRLASEADDSAEPVAGSQEPVAQSSDVAAQGSGKPPAREAKSRDRYVPDLEMRKLIQRFLQQRLEMQLDAGKRRLANLEAQVAVLPSDKRKVLQQRLGKLGRWHTRTRRLLPLIKTFLRIS